jgi:hypothetical protein
VYHPGLTEGNGIYVLSLDTALLVKRVSFADMPRSVSLISANPAYPTRQIVGPELENFRIERQVVQGQRIIPPPQSGIIGARLIF